MGVESRYLSAWQGRFPSSLGNYFEEAPRQRLRLGEKEVTIAIVPAGREAMAYGAFEVALLPFTFWSWSSQKVAHDSQWRVILASPRPGLPRRAREWQTAAAWHIEMDESYESEHEAAARALHLAHWWCTENSKPFDPDHSPYPVSKSISVIRATVGSLIVALFGGSLMAAGGASFAALPVIVDWASAGGAFVVGVVGSQLVAEAIQRKQLKRIREACKQRYQLPQVP